MLRHVSGILVGLALCGTAHAQQAVDQKRIDDAIRKGAAYLKTAESSPWDQHIANSDELILLTFIHADVPESDAKFHEYFQRAMDAKMERTYKVALLAMCLEELDRVKYQPKIKQCAQFLVDNQCQNGQWSYGEHSAFVDGTPSVGTPKAAVASAGKPQIGRASCRERV